MGKSSTISTSKIKKMIAKRKNRIENGRRADLIGSNPHSNGELFSRSLILRLAKIHPKAITTHERIKATIVLQTVLSIIVASEIYSIPC